MRKRYLISLIIIALLSFSGLSLTAFAGGGYTEIFPQNSSSAAKVYLKSPISVAARNDGEGKEIVFIGDRAPSRLVVCYDGGVFEYAVSDPYKMEVYNQFLLIYDRTKISVYDTQVPSAVSLITEFTKAGKIIDDFSVAGSTMFVLFRDSSVQKFDLSFDGTLLINEGAIMDFTEIYPESVTAVSDTSFILRSNNSYSLSDTELNTTALTIPNLSNLRHYGGRLYGTSSGIYSCKLDGSEAISITLATAQKPLFSDLTSAANIFAADGKLYAVDANANAKKIMRFDIETLVFDGFCLGSFSGDLGNFNFPTDISLDGEDIIVSESKNDRVQVIGAQTYAVQIPSPSHAVKQGNMFYAVSGGTLLYGTSLSSSLVLPPQITAITDMVISSDGKLYILSADNLYCFDGISFTDCGTGGGLEISVNIKTGKIYILSDTEIKIFDKNFQFEKTIALDYTDTVFKALETDFAGNIYILMQSLGKSYIAKYSAGTETFEDFLLSGIPDASGLCLNPNSGTMYTISPSLHSMYTISKENMDVAIAFDVPEIILTENPLLNAEISVIVVGGYPSTIFYPFHESQQNSEFIPPKAYNGEIKNIPAGEKVLSVSSSESYTLVLYEGYFGYILSDNISTAENLAPDYENGSALISTQIFSIPLAEGDFLIDTLPAGTKVTISYLLPQYGNSSDWCYVSYGEGKTGFTAKMLITEDIPAPVLQYITGTLQNESGKINLYAYLANGNVISQIDSGTEIKIFSKNGGFALIECEAGGETLRGFVCASDIFESDSLKNQKTGFLLSFATIALAALSYVLYRRYLY